MNELIDKLGSVWRSVAKNLFGPIHSLVKPDVREITVSGTTATFDYSGVELLEYSYVDDIKSERKHIGDILDETEPDDIVFDVGANVGIYSIFLGCRLRSGEVIAFEPHPETYERLRHNVELNDLNGVVDTMNVALADRNGELGLLDRAPTGHQIVEPEEADTTIGVRKGSDIIDSRQMPKPDILKIDVEGAEYEVLRGFGGTLGEFRVVYCEVHLNHLEDRGSTAQGVLDLITDAGFDIVDKTERGKQIHIKAENSN